MKSATPAQPAEWLSGTKVKTRWQAHPLLSKALLLVAAVMTAMVIAVPLDVYQQFAFGSLTVIAALWIRRSVPGQIGVIVMVVLSVTASLRYMFWRLSNTLDFDHLLDGILGWGLVLAEIYALTILLLGYVQTTMPLKRKPQPLPADINTWPTIDVFIPTYNEPLSVVRATVLAAQSMDWPTGRLRVHLLDDGRREEFKVFSQAAGVIYLTRNDNSHAKAGNLNAALARSQGEFVVIFDCDHVPTRSFLQLTLGAFLHDKKLAMLQTPHVFYSPDPFERNLNTFRVVPNEGELFYGLVQDGNDLWNAAFFCGSCAV